MWPWIHHWWRIWSVSSSSLATSSSSLSADQSSVLSGTLLAMTSGFHSSSHVLPTPGTLSASLPW